MHQRHLAAGLAVVVCLSLTGISVVTQEPPASAGPDDGWVPARTPWGDPDLEGIWNSKTQTPLERPDRYAEREFLTDEEVATLERQNVENPGRDERAEPDAALGEGPGRREVLGRVPAAAAVEPLRGRGHEEAGGHPSVRRRRQLVHRREPGRVGAPGHGLITIGSSI